jgi:hypothetical protein
LFTNLPPICSACTPKPVSGLALDEGFTFFEEAIKITIANESKKLNSVNNLMFFDETITAHGFTSQ